MLLQIKYRNVFLFKKTSIFYSDWLWLSRASGKGLLCPLLPNPYCRCWIRLTVFQHQVLWFESVITRHQSILKFCCSQSWTQGLLRNIHASGMFSDVISPPESNSISPWKSHLKWNVESSGVVPMAQSPCFYTTTGCHSSHWFTAYTVAYNVKQRSNMLITITRLIIQLHL